MRASLLTFIFFLILSLAGAARADDVDPLNQRLDRTRTVLDEVEKTLAQPALGDSGLRQLRARVDPIPAEMQEVIEKVTPRLRAIEDRLTELGAAPADAKQPEPKSAAPKSAAPEPKPAPSVAPAPSTVGAKAAAGAKAGAGPAPAPIPAPDAAAAAADRINAETAEQRKLFDASDASLKRARSLMLQARQIIVAIVARQRSLFAKALFLRTNGLFAPALWKEAAAEASESAHNAGAFIADRTANMASRFESGPRALIAGIVALLLALVWPAFLLSRRVLARSEIDAAPSQLQKAAAAARTVLAAAATPIAAVAALLAVADGFDLMDSASEPVLYRIFEGVARVALSYALARAVFAPDRPRWRMVDPGDALAGRLTRLAAMAALALSAARLLEQLEETVQAGLSLVVVTRGVAALIAAVMTLFAVARPTKRTVPPTVLEQKCDGTALTRFTGVLAVLIVVAALSTGYVAFANFFILQIGWMLGVGAALVIVLALVSAGAETLMTPEAAPGGRLTSGLSARHEQLAPVAVLLSGALTLLCYALAFVLALAPLGVESGTFLADLQAAFFTFKIGDVTVSPATALTALLLFAITLGATHGLRRWLDVRYLPLTRLDTGLRNSIGTSLSYTGFILAAGIGLSHIGLGVEKLAIVAGALSVGIGFGLQSIVNNFVSGLILLWERAIRVGDWVVVGDEQGYVKRINVRSTEIETFDRATMIVPNSNLVTGVVKNWLRGDKVGRIKVALQPHISVDPELVRDVLLAVARAQDGILRIPAPQVMFLGMEAASLRFELWCFVEDVEKATRVRSDLYFDLHRRLADAGVRISAEAPAAAAPDLPAAMEKLAAAVAITSFAVNELLDANANDDAKNSRTGVKDEHAAAIGEQRVPERVG